jgi:hypothetical protein
MNSRSSSVSSSSSSTPITTTTHGSITLERLEHEQFRHGLMRLPGEGSKQANKQQQRHAYRSPWGADTDYWRQQKKHKKVRKRREKLFFFTRALFPSFLSFLCWPLLPRQRILCLNSL